MSLIQNPASERETGLSSSNDVEGILPITKSTLLSGWALPGHGSQRPTCGEFRSKGCLGPHESPFEGYAYVKRYRLSCDRAECPVCYEKWASKRAHRIARRIEGYRQRFGGKPIHVVASPSQALVDTLPFEQLKKACLNALKLAGMRGGVEIFHPWREDRNRRWFLSPHFHTIGFGWISNSEKVLSETGVLVKNLGIRKSVYATAMYQLSHCGVYVLKPKKHTIIWWGALSYNKLKLPKDSEVERETCPICLGELQRLIYYGELGDPPDVEDEYLFPALGWRVVTEEGFQPSIADVEDPEFFMCEYCCERFETHLAYERHRCPIGAQAC